MTVQTFHSFYDSGSNAYTINTLKAAAAGKLRPHVFLLHGPNSSGKTHLLRAIQNAASSATRYETADTLTFDLINAINQGQVHDFQRRLAEADILLIDDAQFLAGKELTQDFFFGMISSDHTGCVVIAMDRGVELIRQHCANCRVPYTCLELKQPDLQARVRIAAEQAERLGLEVPAEVIHSIADTLTDVRQIAGFIRSLQAAKELSVPATENRL